MSELLIYKNLVSADDKTLLDSDEKTLMVRGYVEGTIELKLYKNSSEQNRVDKTNYLTSIGSIYGTPRTPISILAITMEIEYPNIPDFNYVYIPQFNRYYYLAEYTIEGYKRYIINLSVDVLMSYKDGIKSLTAFVDRNENTYNPLLSDDKRVVENGAKFDEYIVENSLFTPSPTYVLTGYTITSNPYDTIRYFEISPNLSNKYSVDVSNGIPTWLEWCNSGYNTLGAYTTDYDDYVHITDDIILKSYNGQITIKKYDKIFVSDIITHITLSIGGADNG